MHNVARAALVSLTLTFAGCGAARISSSTVRDVATNAERDGNFPMPIDLYHFEGTLLVRTRCPDNAEVFSRATCAANRETAPFNEIYAALTPEHGGSLPQYEQAAREMLVKINLIDLKLLELLNGSPDDPADGTVPLEAKRRTTLLDLGDVDTSVLELSDQVQRIEEDLAHTSNPDLQAQLTTVRQGLGDAIAIQHRLEDEEDRLIAIGHSSLHRQLLVVHCYRESSQAIRIISARKLTRGEKKQYEEMI